MKTVQVNLRLEPELIQRLQAAADAESLERGTMMRKLLIEALAGWRVEHALRRYQLGEISIGRASEESGKSHWELIELAQRRGIEHRIDVEDSISRGRAALTRRRERVAEGTAEYRAHPETSEVFVARHAPTSPATTAPSERTTSETLPDIPPKPGRVLLVGINPSPPSVLRGHYYQGKLGRRLWKRLHSVGLLAEAVPGLEDEAWAAAGHGLTDLVKRVTASAAELNRKELRDGGQALLARALEWRTALVLFAFKEAAVHTLGRRDVAPGPCGKVAGIPAFLLPGPFVERSEADRTYAELHTLLKRVRLVDD